MGNFQVSETHYIFKLNALAMDVADDINQRRKTKIDDIRIIVDQTTCLKDLSPHLRGYNRFDTSGRIQDVFMVVLHHGSLPLRVMYPYTMWTYLVYSADSLRWHYYERYQNPKAYRVPLAVTGYENLNPQDLYLMSDVLERKPISISRGFRSTEESSYEGGLIKERNEDPTTLYQERQEHAVLIVGDGVDIDEGINYYTFMNSYGESWRENGFFRMASSGKATIPVFDPDVYRRAHPYNPYPVPQRRLNKMQMPVVMSKMRLMIEVCLEEV